MRAKEMLGYVVKAAEAQRNIHEIDPTATARNLDCLVEVARQAKKAMDLCEEDGWFHVPDEQADAVKRITASIVIDLENVTDQFSNVLHPDLHDATDATEGR